jgi:hypothetical protein
VVGFTGWPVPRSSANGLRVATDGVEVSNRQHRDTSHPKETIEMTETQQEYREHQPEPPRNAPEQRNAGFAAGECNPAKYPEDLEIGRFSTGQDESEAIERCSFAEGQATEPKAIDPDEGFAESDR